jgi:hypothetical protein
MSTSHAIRSVRLYQLSSKEIPLTESTWNWKTGYRCYWKINYTLSSILTMESCSSSTRPYCQLSEVIIASTDNNTTERFLNSKLLISDQMHRSKDALNSQLHVYRHTCMHLRSFFLSIEFPIYPEVLLLLYSTILCISVLYRFVSSLCSFPLVLSSSLFLFSLPFSSFHFFYLLYPLFNASPPIIVFKI